MREREKVMKKVETEEEGEKNNRIFENVRQH